MDNKTNKNRIAKNTIVLYIRMLLVMVVSIYTSRVILNILGATDYGLYNVVGSLVTMMGFLNGALSSSTSRFLTYELGTNNQEQLNKTFSASLNLHIAVAILMVVISEIIGLWFIYNKLVIPDDRINAALWVFQFSVITTFLNFTQVPYSASLLAHEKMSIYAYVGLYEAFSKLLIVYLLSLSPIDKLVFYAFLLLANTVFIQLFYRYYSYKNYIECRFRWIEDSRLYKKLLSYSGWDLFGGFASICQNQGMNMLLNVFFGPAVNASRAIALQMQSALNGFVTNFIQAVRPQVIKNYAIGDYDEMYKLTFQTTKYSFMLMLMLILPFCYEIDFILQLWLGENVPLYTNVFAVLILITALFQTWSSSRLMAYHAIGRIKAGNVFGGSIMVASLPLSYVALRYDMPPYSVFVIIFITNFLTQINGTYLIHKYVHFNLKKVLKTCYWPCIEILIISSIAPMIILNYMENGWVRFIVLTVISELILMILVWFRALDKNERNRISILLINKLKRNVEKS